MLVWTAARVNLTGAPLQLCSLYVLLSPWNESIPLRIACAILDAPGWARVGITAPSSCLREDAALELARVIADAMIPSASDMAEAQTSLPL